MIHIVTKGTYYPTVVTTWKILTTGASYLTTGTLCTIAKLSIVVEEKIMRIWMSRLNNFILSYIKLFLTFAFVLIALFAQVVTGRFKADSFVLLLLNFDKWIPLHCASDSDFVQWWCSWWCWLSIPYPRTSLKSGSVIFPEIQTFLNFPCIPLLSLILRLKFADTGHLWIMKKSYLCWWNQWRYGKFCKL